MSDARLRELERRFRDSGSVDAEAEYLRERVRAGVLAPVRLEAAAHLGYEPARRALPGPLPPGDGPSLGYWDALLQRRGEGVARPLVRLLEADPGALRRLALAVTTRVWRHVPDPDPAEANLLAEVGRELVAPDPARLQRLAAAQDALPPSGGDWFRPFHMDGTPARHARAALHWTLDALTLRGDPQTGPSGAANRAARSAWASEMLACGGDLAAAIEPARERLRPALVAALVPWLLGTGEPLASSAPRRDGC